MEAFRKIQRGRDFLVVQWIRLHAPNTGGGMSSIPDQGTKIPYAMRGMANKKNKKKRKEIEGKEVGRGTQRAPHRGGGRQDKTQRLPRSTSYVWDMKLQ